MQKCIGSDYPIQGKALPTTVYSKSVPVGQHGGFGGQVGSESPLVPRKSLYSPSPGQGKGHDEMKLAKPRGRIGSNKDFE